VSVLRRENCFPNVVTRASDITLNRRDGNDPLPCVALAFGEPHFQLQLDNVPHTGELLPEAL